MYVAGRTNTRALNTIFLTLPTIISSALMVFLPSADKAGKPIGNYSLPLIYSWISASFAGHTKKKVTMNVILMSFCLEYYWTTDVYGVDGSDVYPG
jgi:hypothetical protein